MSFTKNINRNTQKVANKNTVVSSVSTDEFRASKFDLSYRHITTIDSGVLVPIMTEEILPGDIIDLNVSSLIKMSTPQAATMESPVVNIKAFFVPNRVVFKQWVNLMGEDQNGEYAYEKVEQAPYINCNYTDKNNYYKEKDVAAYMGVPINTSLQGLKINALPFLSYAKIWNDWYRDENLMSPINIDFDGRIGEGKTNSVNISSLGGEKYLKSIQVGFGLAPVCRMGDMFSYCLPWPEKGGDTTLFDLSNLYVKNNPNAKPVMPVWYEGTETAPTNKYAQGRLVAWANSGVAGMATDNISGGPTSIVTRLGVDSTSAINSTVNNFRMSVAIQHLKERDALYGTRYVEYLQGHWGVKASSSLLQRSEYLGGFKFNVGVNNVIQTSSSVGDSPIGSMGGYSMEINQSKLFNSFAADEHGWLMVVATIKPEITYSKGLPKKFTKLRKYDFFDPLFDNLGNQPVLKREINLQQQQNKGAGQEAKLNEIFGYQEAWYEYRYTNNIASGFMSSMSKLSLADLYTYTEKDTQDDSLTPAWMLCDSDIIGKTLILSGGTKGELEYNSQFLCDFFFNYYNERKMATHSIPGLRRI